VRTIVIGSRGSRLALWQAEWLAARLAAAGRRTRIDIVRTQGDRLLDQSLAAMGGKGVFVKEIEDALLAGAVDVAAHSLKDLPTAQPQGLKIVCIPTREDPRDVLVTAEDHGIDRLRRSAVVGTGSPRRACQLRKLRPDCVIRDLRGNVETRLSKLDRGGYDAIVLARAGLNRLGIDVVGQDFDPDQMLPAPGQGAMAIETRADDHELQEILTAQHDPASAAAVTAERAFLAGLGGGCQAPIAALGEVREGRLSLSGLVAGPDGKTILRERREGDVSAPEVVGHSLARALEAMGAVALIEAAALPPRQAP
jgi:hydroxymethylbilane synthase